MRRRFAIMGFAVGTTLLGPGLAEPAPKVSISPEEPSARNPVAAGAALSLAKVRPGGTTTLAVRVKLAPTWHIYAADGPTGGSIPTTLKLKLPKGVEEAGDWSYPKPIPNPAGEGLVYEGDLMFRRSLKLAADVPPGPIQVTCEVGYMACDPFSCRPPAKLTLNAKCEVETSP